MLCLIMLSLVYGTSDVTSTLYWLCPLSHGLLVSSNVSFGFWKHRATINLLRIKIPRGGGNWTEHWKCLNGMLLSRYSTVTVADDVGGRLRTRPGWIYATWSGRWEFSSYASWLLVVIGRVSLSEPTPLPWKSVPSLQMLIAFCTFFRHPDLWAFLSNNSVYDSNNSVYDSLVPIDITLRYNW